MVTNQNRLSMKKLLIRDLCIKQDSRDFSFFNIDELKEMVILLCTT